jgi:TonB family protein
MVMFETVPVAGRKRRSRSVALSFAAHVVVLGALAYRAAPEFITPSDVALGIPNSSGSQSIIYLAPVGPEQAKTSSNESKLTLRAKLAPKPKPAKPEPKRQELAAQTADHAAQQTARGGSIFGRVPGSPLPGNEVIPAFPDVYPDPAISHTDLPSGIQGDVIVEVTIDPQGNVVDTKLLQGIGYGIEQKVLEVLQRWHFHPAMRDGVTIASQHIIHFHYPA